MTGFAHRRRLALVDLLVEVGPDAPTLCEGWLTRDLAAHLVVRERRPVAALGLVVPPLAGHLERARRAIRDNRSWEELTALVRGGPPLPLRPVEELIDLTEFFVHHEDVLRADPERPVQPSEPGLERALWSQLRFLALRARRRLSGGVRLSAPGYGTLAVRAGEQAVTVTGAPGELVLFLLGRQGAAAVEVSGDPQAVARVRGADLRI